MNSERQLLLKQIGLEDCPICAVLDKFEFNLMADLQADLGEQNSLQAKEIISNSGFCNYHWHKLFKMSSPRHISKFLITYIEDFSQRQLCLPELWEAECSVCNAVEAKNKKMIYEFSCLYQNEADFRKEFQENSQLCLPHLQQVISAEMSQSLKKDLLQHHKEVFAELKSNLTSFIQKQYYSQTEDYERIAPQKTIDLLAGYHGTKWLSYFTE